MAAPSSPVEAPAGTDLALVPVNMVYDAQAQTVAYNGGNPGQPLILDLITEPTNVVVTLTTTNPGSGGPASFSNFNFDPDQWSDQLVLTFNGPTQITVTVPPGLQGPYTFVFTPQVNAPVQKPASVTMPVATTGDPIRTLPPSPIPIDVTFDPVSGKIGYSPDSVVVAENQAVTIALTSQTPGLSFYGFLPNLQGSKTLSAWAAKMRVALTATTVTVYNPNLIVNAINGVYGFSLSYNYKGGGGTQNPDPTIYNEPIGGTLSAPEPGEEKGEEQAA